MLTEPAVSWQYLVNNDIGGTLDSTNFGKYDQLMQICLATDAYCAIDIHNFARVNAQIIGQGGPSNAQFADLWTQLSTKYKDNSKVVFGLMNEPHDVDIGIWANTVHAAVTAIRTAGATTQMILLPGNNFTSAGQFVSNGSGGALLNVTNPDGSTTGLIMDVHKYLDVDNSGEHAECTTDNISDAFAIVAAFLRENGRQAMVSETGAGSTSSVGCSPPYKETALTLSSASQTSAPKILSSTRTQTYSSATLLGQQALFQPCMF